MIGRSYNFRFILALRKFLLSFSSYNNNIERENKNSSNLTFKGDLKMTKSNSVKIKVNFSVVGGQIPTEDFKSYAANK
jgi:hypothetical protein